MTAPPELAVVLARLEVKLDTLIGSTADHEKRLRELEQAMPIKDNKGNVVTAEMLIRAVALIVGVVTGVWVIP